MKEGVIFQTKQLTIHIDRYDHITARVKGVSTVYRADNFALIPTHLQDFFMGKRIRSIFHRASSAQKCTDPLKKTLEQITERAEKIKRDAMGIEIAKNRLAADAAKIPWYDHHWSYNHGEYCGLDNEMVAHQHDIKSYEQFLTTVQVSLDEFLQSDLRKQYAYVRKGINLLTCSIQELAETLANLHEIRSANNILYSISLKLGWRIEMSTQASFVESKTKVELYNPALLDYYTKAVEDRIKYISNI